jgi:hypothetical protein
MVRSFSLGALGMRSRYAVFATPAGQHGCNCNLVHIRNLNRRFGPFGGLQTCFSCPGTQVCMLPTLPRRQLRVIWMVQRLGDI